MKKIYELNLDYINNKDINCEDKYSFDYLFDYNVNLINDIDDMHYGKRIKPVYFKYKDKFFKATVNKECDSWNKCQDCLNGNCQKFFSICIPEIMYGNDDDLLLNEVDEYEVTFGDD